MMGNNRTLGKLELFVALLAVKSGRRSRRKGVTRDIQLEPPSKQVV